MVQSLKFSSKTLCEILYKEGNQILLSFTLLINVEHGNK